MGNKGQRELLLAFAKDLLEGHDVDSFLNRQRLTDAQEIEEPPILDKYQKLFDHLQDEHGLILLESEMQEIISLSLECENGQESTS